MVFLLVWAVSFTAGLILSLKCLEGWGLWSGIAGLILLYVSIGAGLYGLFTS